VICLANHGRRAPYGWWVYRRTRLSTLCRLPFPDFYL